MRMRNILSMIALTTASATSMLGAGAIADRRDAPVRVEGCALLANPARFNNRLVEVSGRAYGAFESWSISFNCPGYLNLSQSLYEPDIQKFGFKTLQDDKMAQFSRALFPNPDPMSRETHHARVTIVGRFRCHYDFPDCKKISIDGDSSIVIRSILSVSTEEGAPPLVSGTKE